ncbi:hypothetical protein PLESTB_001106200 [Pleodorina starrii]|uniref:Uncharacterized protein n=1 Tax=Pleodorina starrii TaxID=330485 RepID=A0A9W6BRL3_9CHLO|nr:hypothetical protein PLESTM_001341200 [Pleodorina starrii]GLC56452.1 hypothetical protein PLESTB_001106200 [Pleodorina starrii]GLC68951.1 hypothetical protein PLESTF_000762300 [Pleodorina starrii]
MSHLNCALPRSAAPAASPISAAPFRCCAAPRRCCRLPRRPFAPAPIAAAAADGASFSSSNGTEPASTSPLSTTSPARSQQPQTSATQQGSGAPTDAATSSAAPPAQEQEPEPVTLLGRVKRFFTGSKLDKARLAALGFGAFSAYGVISNINAGVLITIAWLTVVRTTGLTPLDGSNWSRFLAIYAGLWIGSNFLRPLRLTLALAAAPLFDAAIGAVARATRLPKVPAFVLMLLGIAVMTTSSLLAAIAVLGGFPPGCRMPWQPLLAA